MLKRTSFVALIKKITIFLPAEIPVKQMRPILTLVKTLNFILQSLAIPTVEII